MIALFTFVATLALAPRIDLAVLLGMAAAAGVHLIREASRLSVETEADGSTLTMRPSGVLFYASSQAFAREFNENLAQFPDVTRVVIDLEGVGRLDLPGTMQLKTVAWDAEQAGLEVDIVNVPEHAAGVMSRAQRFIEESGGGRPNPLVG